MKLLLCITKSIKLFQTENLASLPVDVATQLRDPDGNSLLHRSVLDGNVEAVKILADRHPGMCSDMNNDKMTAVELAVKVSLSLALDLSKNPLRLSSSLCIFP